MVVFESATVGQAPGFTSIVSEFHVAENAKLVSAESSRDQPRASRFPRSTPPSSGTHDSRPTCSACPRGSSAARSRRPCSHRAAGPASTDSSSGRGDSHHDHFTTAEHAAPHCESDEEYRGSSRTFGRCLPRPRVRPPDAQKTDARQSNPNLLLSEGASIDTKPQLEIYADDVKASHGSTIGQLDDEALFFLRAARGIDEETARLVLTRGFAQTFVDGLFRRFARALVADRLDEALARSRPPWKPRPGSPSA